MSDLLLIIGSDDREPDLLEQAVRARPKRVTVLLDHAPDGWAQEDSPAAQAVRTRLATLLTAIELRTGAAVIGIAGDSDQLRGWRFDRVVASEPSELIAA